MANGTEAFDFDEMDFNNAMGRRQFKRQTKEEQIYGVWADEDEAEDERPSFRDSRKRPKDSAPVAFVSGGVKLGSKNQLPDGTFKDVDEEVAVEARPEKRGKPSFAPQSTTSKPMGSQVFAGMRSSNFQAGAGTTTDSAWMKSGKGNVIMQMMQKMGYEHGKGLGKGKQGIVEPVQAVARPGRGAVGAYGSEAKGPKFGESAAEAQARISGVDDAASEEIGAVLPPSGQWKKNASNKKVKIQYKTLNDVISEGESHRYGIGAIGAGSGVGKIIDMTGPQQRVYDDFSSFTRRARMPIPEEERTKFNIPELTHNLTTLLDVTEEEICRVDREIRHLRDQNEVLKGEENRIAEQIEENMNEVRRLEEVEQLVNRFCCTSNQLSLEESKKLFVKMRTDCSAEYVLYGLDAIAIPAVLPKIQKYFTNWDPLDPEQTSYGYAMMSEWREILGSTKGGALFKHFDKESSGSISAYDQCIWNGWMPNVRRAAIEWSPRNNGPIMNSLVQMWMPILPSWVLENLLEQVLIPRIKTQVDNWDPISDIVPIESWLLPWHEIMGDRLLLAYATVRQKLAKGLKNWMPGDRSAIESIRPWRNVFSASTMQAFVNMNIVPKLERSLQTIDIRKTEEFEYLELFDWMEFVGSEAIGHILSKHFFPRYYDHLRIQLSSPMMSLADLERFKKEYMNWKSLFSQEILSQQLVMAELKRTLLVIVEANARLTGAPVPGLAQQQRQTPRFAVPPINAAYVQLPPANFKQLVESNAVSHAIQFFPQRGKFHEGKQVYMFGDFSIYIDGTMLFYYNPPKRQWLPVSLNQLVEMSKERS